jgi:hypothetical protein
LSFEVFKTQGGLSSCSSAMLDVLPAMGPACPSESDNDADSVATLDGFPTSKTLGASARSDFVVCRRLGQVSHD